MKTEKIASLHLDLDFSLPEVALQSVICLDTNVVIGALNGNERLRQQLVRCTEPSLFQ